MTWWSCWSLPWQSPVCPWWGRMYSWACGTFDSAFQWDRAVSCMYMSYVCMHSRRYCTFCCGRVDQCTAISSIFCCSLSIFSWSRRGGGGRWGKGISIVCLDLRQSHRTWSCRRSPRLRWSWGWFWLCDGPGCIWFMGCPWGVLWSTPPLYKKTTLPLGAALPWLRSFSSICLSFMNFCLWWWLRELSYCKYSSRYSRCSVWSCCFC